MQRPCWSRHKLTLCFLQTSLNKHTHGGCAGLSGTQELLVVRLTSSTTPRVQEWQKDSLHTQTTSVGPHSSSEQISAAAVSSQQRTYFTGHTHSCRAGDVRLCCRANKTDYKRYISELQLAGGVLQRKQLSATLTHTQSDTPKTGRPVLIAKRLCLHIKFSQHALILQADDWTLPP